MTYALLASATAAGSELLPPDSAIPQNVGNATAAVCWSFDCVQREQLPHGEDGMWPVSQIRVRVPGASVPARNVCSFIIERSSIALGDFLRAFPEPIPEE